MSSLVLLLTLAAWPLPRDAGVAEAADPANWPNEPEWSQAWPLYSFVPTGWSLSAAEASTGVGMRVDLAWRITRGRPDVVIGVVAARADLSDPVLAGAWRLNAGELPDAGDRNGNGRLELADLETDPRVSDVNANGALDLEDVVEAFRDGLDQDGDGRADDVCGWDFARDEGVRSSPDAGSWRPLAAPVNDGRPGIGICPECTIVPFVAEEARLADAVRLALDAGVRVLLLPATDQERSAELDRALDDAAARMVVIAPGSGDERVFPLTTHPAVLSPRTLTATAARTTARSREGCGGHHVAGRVSVSTAGCATDAALELAGLAALVLSANPSLTPTQVLGLLGGARVDAARAVELAEAGVPDALQPVTPLRPVGLGPIRSTAPGCAVRSSESRPEETVACQAPTVSGERAVLERSPLAAWVHFIERQGPFAWWTPLPAPHEDLQRDLRTVEALGPGSGPPRFVDVDGLGSEVVLAASSADGGPGRLPIAVGDLDGDLRLEVVHAGDDGWLRVSSLAGRTIPEFPERLEAPLAGGPLLLDTLGGTALVTVDVNGRVTSRVRDTRWTFELGAPQRSGPAGGRIDGDDVADLAIANGEELRVLLLGSTGPNELSWRQPTRATQALLGNLTGDARLELVVDRVYDARGRALLELRDWTPAVTPPALARLGPTARRSLVQVEATVDGAWELTRYEVERAIDEGDAFATRQVLRRFEHPPARGGFAVADVTGDDAPDVLLPTEDGLLFIIDATGGSPDGSPLPTWGSVFGAPSLGVSDNELQYAVRTTRGDLVRWVAHALPSGITWEGAGHDRANTFNAETPLPKRTLRGLGITGPPLLQEGCGCTGVHGIVAGLALFLFRRRRQTC